MRGELGASESSHELFACAASHGFRGESAIMKRKHLGSPSRRGTAAVELAVCLPFLMILLVGVWEVGRMVEVKQLMCNAVREGGRQAATGTQTTAQVKQYVVNYLNTNGIS